MGKTKKAKADTRNWLDQLPTLAMRREVENATTHLCLRKKIEPSKMTRDSVAFVDLLPYLKVEHDRWDDIEPGDFTTTRPKCIKLLYDHYHHLKRNTVDLQELMEANKDRFSLRKAPSSDDSSGDEQEQDDDNRPDDQAAEAGPDKEPEAKPASRPDDQAEQAQPARGESHEAAK